MQLFAGCWAKCHILWVRNKYNQSRSKSLDINTLPFLQIVCLWVCMSTVQTSIVQPSHCRRPCSSPLLLSTCINQPDCFPYTFSPLPSFLALHSSMSRPGVWGDHVTLQAAANAYGVRICVVSSFLEQSVISIEPREPAVMDRILWLSFWAEVRGGRGGPGGEVCVAQLLGRGEGGRGVWLSFWAEVRGGGGGGCGSASGQR